MTEIPEHLLKRSRERRAAIGQAGGDDGDAAAPAESDSATATTATTAEAATAPASTGPAPRAAAPAAPEPKPPKPDPAYVVAAKQRRKVPWWAMATLSLMPVWGFMYVRALTEPVETAEGPLGIGAEVYTNCASCHGANGGGVAGLGYPFSSGEVLLTFPNIEDQIRYVVYGTEGYNLEGIEIYGDPNREGGPHMTNGRGVMPAFGDQLEPAEILGVICHERYTLGGADPTSEEWAEEYEQWCSEESPVFEAIEGGEFELEAGEVEPFETDEGEEFDINPIGPVPVPGLP